MTRLAEKQRSSVEQRRARVIELYSRGKNLGEIAKILQVNVSTISHDYQHIKENANRITEQYLNETVPLELAKCLSRLNAVSDEAWVIVEQANDHKEKIAALSLAMKAAVQLVNVVINKNDAINGADIGERLEKLEEGILNGKKSESDLAKTVF